MHLGACHFVAALNISGLQKAWKQVHGAANSEETDEYDEEFDVDTSPEIEASAGDIEAVQVASVTDFEAGDVLGKVMAFIAQLRLCSEDTHYYLKEFAVGNGCLPLEIKLWVHTWWGSLSDCLRTILELRKVHIFCILFVLVLMYIL